MRAGDFLCYNVCMREMLPFFKRLDKAVGTAKDKTGFRISPWPLLILGTVFFVMAFIFMPAQVEYALSLALFLSPVWLPYLLVNGAWRLWLNLRRSVAIAKQKNILLEIKPPRNLDKTPLAMEAVLSGMHFSGGDGNWYEKYFMGKLRPWWSLEIVSIEGQVHFFVWVQAKMRKLIEAQIYAQYPGAQVVEAPDYTRMLSATPEDWAIWGCDFVHTNKDPIPLKTYVEYGLDRVQKEPEQVDPLANLIEFMGSIGKGEYLWLQFIVRAHKGEKYKGELNKKGKQKTWKDEAEELVQQIRIDARSVKDPKTGEKLLGAPPTKGQAELMAAIERNISKLGFDVGARGVYLAHPDHFDPINITGLTGMFKQFSSETWNGIRPAHWMTEFNGYPWEIGANRLKDEYRRGLISAYRRRQYFHEPIALSDYMIMSTEELATIYHIPSLAVGAPSLMRIQSATSEAPSNLPV